MKKIRVGINGFGRIGRVFFRQAFEHQEIEIVGINDPHDQKISAHLIQYDSTYGHYAHHVKTDENYIIVDQKKILATHERDPKNIPWKSLGVDVVIEATGIFRSKEQALWHIDAGTKKVIVTAPPKGELDHMIVIGVNEETYDPKKHHIISNASCTTNSLAPVVKILHKKYGIKKGLMTTVHAFTNDQAMLDSQHHDLRRSRTAISSIIPTTTGAAEAVTKVIPELSGKLTGLALRVPITIVSITDFVAELEESVTPQEINQTFKEASQGHLKGILAVSEEPLVSIDYKGNNHSSIIDALSTMVIGGNLIKILAWYDNEWGYSHRLVDLCLLIRKKWSI